MKNRKRALESIRSTVFGSLFLGLVLGVLSAGTAGAISDDEDRLFRFAAHDKDNGTVRQLLAEGVSPNAAGNFDGRTAVHSAAKGGAAKNLAAMLQAGGKPNVQDGDGDTPLHLASKGSYASGFSDHPAAVRVLLQHGANLHRTNSSGETPLHVAVFTGVSAAHVGVIKALLDAGARPSAVDGNGLTVLQRFSRHSENNGAIVRLLLRAGANPDQKDPRGDAPLHAAIKTGGSYGKAEVVEALLDGGANPCVRDARGSTPYHMSSDLNRIHRALARAGGSDASHASGQGCWWDDDQRTDRVEADQTNDDSSEMAYQGETRNDDSSDMAYEKVAQLGGVLRENDGSDDSPEMGYERELRAWEAMEEARRAEAARIAEEARKAKEARRAEAARSRQARRQQQNRVPDSRRSSNGALRSSNCQDVTPTCSRILATIEARMAPIKARLDAGGLSVSRSAELTAQMFKIFLDQAPICYATEIRPQCKAANQRDLEQARRSYESALKTARQARGESRSGSGSGRRLLELPRWNTDGSLRE